MTPWLITANQRQALAIRSDFAQYRVWTWSACLEACWRMHAAQYDGASWRWLTAFEQQLLWQSVLQEAQVPQHQHVSLAKACMEAWYWLHAWQIPWSALRTHATANSQWFYAMAQAYQTRCRQQRSIDPHQALPRLLQQPLKGLPKRVFFYRFWQRPPALQAFQQWLQQQGVIVETPPLPTTVAECWRHEADSPEQELTDMVEWLAQQAKAYPQASFACVVTDLQQQRPHLEACLHRKLDATLLNQVHFSLGQALIDFPLIQVAWRLVHMAYQDQVSLDDLHYLSHSPFWAYADEVEGLVSRWRQQQWPSLPAEAWGHFASDRLQDWRHQVQQFSQEPALASVWQQRWQAILHLSAWPSPELSSAEQALVQRLEESWSEWAALDELVGELSLSDALGYWQQLLNHSIFAMAPVSSPRLYFLGLLEALGSDFDYVWLSDVVAMQWPKLPRANTFIPSRCQQQYHLPGATPDDSAMLQQSLWQAFSHSASQLIVSYAQWHKGEHQQTVTHCQAWPLLGRQTPTPMVSQPWPLTPAYDHQALALDSEIAPGGTAALKAQANCPFQALARYRLQLHALPSPQMALTAAERGMLVHKALQLIWQHLGDQRALLALTPDALSALVQGVSRRSVRYLNVWRRKLLAKALLQLEQQRLQHLLSQWLALEAKRPPFTVVQTEHHQEAVFAGKKWRFKADRLDRLLAGDYLLLDYKTGLTPIAWQSETLVEPQLPFYALMQPEPVTAMAVAQVNRRQFKVTGLAAQAIDMGVLGQLTPVTDWSEQLAAWYRAMEALAHAYVVGDAPVQPISEATCRGCDLQAVCRIYDRQAPID